MHHSLMTEQQKLSLYEQVTAAVRKAYEDTKLVAGHPETCYVGHMLKELGLTVAVELEQDKWGREIKTKIDWYDVVVNMDTEWYINAFPVHDWPFTLLELESLSNTFEDSEALLEECITRTSQHLLEMLNLNHDEL